MLPESKAAAAASEVVTRPRLQTPSPVPDSVAELARWHTQHQTWACQACVGATKTFSVTDLAWECGNPKAWTGEVHFAPPHPPSLVKGRLNEFMAMGRPVWCAARASA
jgi:hypothetical protein